MSAPNISMPTIIQNGIALGLPRLVRSKECSQAGGRPGRSATAFCWQWLPRCRFVSIGSESNFACPVLCRMHSKECAEVGDSVHNRKKPMSVVSVAHLPSSPRRATFHPTKMPASNAVWVNTILKACTHVSPVDPASMTMVRSSRDRLTLQVVLKSEGN